MRKLDSSALPIMDSDEGPRGSVAKEVGVTQRPGQSRKKIEGQLQKTEGVDQ